MAPMKRAQAAGKAKGVITRCDSLKKAVRSAGCEDRIKQMLCSSISCTVGTPAADRHPFSERFVAMIEEVLASEQARLKTVVETVEHAFNELTPAKATREAECEAAKALAVTQGTALSAAKQAVTEQVAHQKAANAELQTARKAQKAGDDESHGINSKKAMLVDTQSSALVPLVDGTAEEDGKAEKAKAVMGAGQSFGFDASLMSTAAQVLQKPVAERGSFDNTALQQLGDAFASAIAKFDEELAAAAPGQAARAAAAAQAEAAKNAADTTLADLKEKAAAAKDAKAAAGDAVQAAVTSFDSFMPDLKRAGDALDEAKRALQSFIDGPQVAFAELKNFKEGDFDKKKAPIPEPVPDAGEAETVPMDTTGA